VLSTRRWAVGLGIPLLVMLLVGMTRGFWVPAIGRSLACTEDVRKSDIIVVENFDPTYLLFERAAALQRAGLSARVAVPVDTSPETQVANMISAGIAELMARVARVQNVEIIRIYETEPVTLNATYQIRDFLTTEHLRSVTVVTPGFRSRRSSLVYHAALERAGIRVSCVPVFGFHTRENWMDSWHGRQDVIQQFLKLQYYRFYVLPFARARA
jgi:hypothetical protein